MRTNSPTKGPTSIIIHFVQSAIDLHRVVNSVLSPDTVFSHNYGTRAI